MKVPGIKFDQGRHPQGALTPTAIVLHRTYGARGKDTYKGAYSIGKNGRGGVGIGFHFLVGKNEGQAVQFYDTTVEAAHAKGANSWSVGIEFDGVNEDVLTEWQVRQGALIIRAVCEAHGIPLTYTTQGARRRIAGCMPHALVPGSDHTDLVTEADWRRMFAAAATPQTQTQPQSIKLKLKEDDMVRTPNGTISAVSATEIRMLSAEEWAHRSEQENPGVLQISDAAFMKLCASRRVVDHTGKVIRP